VACQEDTLTTSEKLTLAVALLAALIGASATIYASVRASSRRRSNAPRLEAVLNLRKKAQIFIPDAAQEVGRNGGRGSPNLPGTTAVILEHAAHQVLALDDFGPLRDALQSLYLAFGWEYEADDVARARRRGRAVAADQSGSEQAAAIVEAGIEVERATRAMAKNYGRKLEKPVKPWAYGPA
jgi:hypothetical protein